ncbi:MAG: VOC family protein [Thaumarchaeota archaeon]|nr:VOC family protein [Nitrososphaerota archaeon]
MIDQQTSVGVHHMGVTVSNLERSIDFYKQLGFRLLFSPLQYSGKDLDRSLNVEGAKLRSAMLKAGDGTMIELLQYLEPEGRAYDRRNCDTGSMHIAFRVPDIERAFSEFKKTVHFNSEPSTVNDGPLKGIKFVYLVDPDGVTLEFFQESPESISSKD